MAPAGAREIIDNCLFGVDIDPEAVEIARMSLALRYLDRTSGLGMEPHLLLKGIGRNIRQGNSLVGPDIVGLGLDPEKVIRETMPFDWENRVTGFGDVIATGGFDAVVGNPPYIEVKRYREWMPAQYKYLKESGAFETTVQGKTDLAMPFMEKGLKLLRPGGRLGFIIQNGDGEVVLLDRGALRPLCRNRGFYPFRINRFDLLTRQADIPEDN